jgi:hypothetical protein
MKEAIPNYSQKGPEIRKKLFFYNILNVLHLYWPDTKNNMASWKLQKTTSRQQSIKTSEL